MQIIVRTMHNFLITLLLCILPVSVVFADALHYQAGDSIADEVFVSDKDGSAVVLKELFREQPATLNVLYVFGGGDMGAGMNGHLWCQDSYEDSYILRTLKGLYTEEEVNFVAVAEPPAYHPQVLGKFTADVFFNEPEGSRAFRKAKRAFIKSTMAAYEAGVLPVEPLFDLRLRLLLNRDERLLPGENFGELQDWYGAFRATDDSQFYGVPNIWLLSDEGEILEAPLRGNVYHPHGSEIQINYTVSDLINLIDARLGR